ncbi:MAG: biotin--[acetyl-CoA-carboxylase] ligase [Proteobacteria bacterium]|nr:biotin--[acetyl-CoA-carboxylase] ligase [Pseudomonadota bacterium]
MSVLLYPLVPKRITDLPFLVGIAVTQTLQQALPKYLEVSLKWPNDVLVNQKKIAGILSEAFDHNEFYGAVVGVGINVNLEPAELAPFEKNLFSATSVQAITGETGTSLEDILTIFKVKLFNLYRVYQEKGFAPIQALWERNCKMIGKKIEIRNVEPKGETVVGNFWGLSERGGIVLEIPGKDKMEILSGELACCWF